jgi:crotonobetainyl-CoA:carnitine CoA-transferase CaiB-like acyl-CoA transferase
VTKDEQAWANEMFRPVEHPEAGKIHLVTSPVNFEATPASIRSPAPDLGQNTEEVLLELGYDWDELVQLKEQKIIG